MPLITAEPHCPTCRCPAYRYDVTVYPPNAKLWGQCMDCGQPRFTVEVYDRSVGDWGKAQTARLHCGCCKHEHDLARGGHTFGRLMNRMLREGEVLA